MSRLLGMLSLFCGGLVVGAVAGWAVSSQSDDGRILDLERERDAAVGSAEEATRRADAIAGRLDSFRGRAGTRAGAEAGSLEEATAADDPSAATAADAETSSEAEEDELTAEQRAQRVTGIVASIDDLFANAKGEAAIAALKSLAGLAPEGRLAAMELAVRINADVNGKGVLKLGQMTFYGSLGDAAVRNLMVWSLDNPSLDDFRVISAYSLPWVQDPKDTAIGFAKALAKETNFDVQEALVSNLARLRKPEAVATLTGIFVDASQDGLLRARVATELATSEDPKIVAALERAAADDPDLDVRAAARAALMARNPPASGYLVTGTVPESQGQAAGMRAGDIVLSYDGEKVRDARALSRASRGKKGPESISMIVLRDGGEVTLLVRPGQLGVYGRSVKAAEGE